MIVPTIDIMVAIVYYFPSISIIAVMSLPPHKFFLQEALWLVSSFISEYDSNGFVLIISAQYLLKILCD
jgi:hypothetical protein